MAGMVAIAVIGVGNEYRQDDGVGVYVARRVRQSSLPNVRVVEHVSDGAALVHTWEEAACVFVIDCVVSGAAPGTIFRWDAWSEPIPAEVFAGRSTHTFNVTEAIELGRALHRLPPMLIVYGIEGVDFSFGLGLTPAVDAAAQEAALRIIREIGGAES